MIVDELKANSEELITEVWAPPMGIEIKSNRCLSNCLVPTKTLLPIEAEAAEKPCHCEEGVSPTWQSVL